MIEELYSTKATQYYTQVRTDLISLLPPSRGLKVLEIGAGGGDTLVYLKTQELASEVVGVDIFSLPNTNQQSRDIDNFLVLNIETESLPYEQHYFDAVLCGDVVEHLVDPWEAISKVAGYLKPGGLFILSTPNFRHIDNFISIYVRGDFKYDPAGGLLDRTHLRYFCRKNIADLVQSNELAFQAIYPITAFKDYQPRPFVKLFNLLTGKLFEEFLTLQYVAVGRKK